MTDQQKLFLNQLIAQVVSGRSGAEENLYTFVDEMCEAAVVCFALAAERASDPAAHVKNTLSQYEQFGLLGHDRVRDTLAVDLRPAQCEHAHVAGTCEDCAPSHERD